MYGTPAVLIELHFTLTSRSKFVNPDTFEILISSENKNLEVMPKTTLLVTFIILNVMLWPLLNLGVLLYLKVKSYGQKDTGYTAYAKTNQ